MDTVSCSMNTMGGGEGVYDAKVTTHFYLVLRLRTSGGTSAFLDV
jgi:hypothetical protein